MKFYLFAKFFQHLSVDELMDRCVELGVDGPTALIREGYWVRPDHVAEDLPVFVKAAQAKGLEVKYADTPFEPEHIWDYENDVKALSECGVELFRIGYLFKQKAGHPRGMYEKMRGYAEQACALAKKYGIKAVIQIHGMMYPHNASTAYPLVQGLDPKHIGIKLDYGNNCSQEGYEIPEYQIPLLGEYTCALGAKSGAFMQVGDRNDDDNGWKGVFLPAYEGQANFRKMYSLLKKEGFSGPSLLMPFYDEKDFDILFAKAKKELAYLKRMEAEA